MRLKTNRKHLYQKQTIEGQQHGEGIREVAAWILRKGKRGLVYAKKHSADIAKLAAAAIKLYNGDTSSVIEAMKTATTVLGLDELSALKNIIQNKSRAIAPDPVKPVSRVVEKIAPDPVKPVSRVVEKITPDRGSLRSPPTISGPPIKKPKSTILEQIQARPALRPVTARTIATPASAPSGSLAGMLEAIRARRAYINPDEEEVEQSGVGAQRILLKMAKHAMKGKGVSADRTMPGTRQYISGTGRVSDVLGGISTISGIASTIPGPHEIVTVPLTVIAGLAGGIAKIFGKGAMRGGSLKDIKKIIYNRILQARRDMKDGGYMPSLLELSKEIVMDVLGVGSKMLEAKVRSMLGSGLKLPGQGTKPTYKGSGILDIGVKFLTGTILPKILKKLGLHLSKSDLQQLEKLVKQVVGDEPLTIKRAIKVAQDLAPHLYRLYKGKQGGTGLKLSGGRKALTSMIAREIIKRGATRT